MSRLKLWWICFKIEKKEKDKLHSLIIHLSFAYPLNCGHCNSPSLMLPFNHFASLGISLFNIVAIYNIIMYVHYIIHLLLVIATLSFQ